MNNPIPTEIAMSAREIEGLVHDAVIKRGSSKEKQGNKKASKQHAKRKGPKRIRVNKASINITDSKIMWWSYPNDLSSGQNIDTVCFTKLKPRVSLRAVQEQDRLIKATKKLRDDPRLHPSASIRSRVV
ncbi:hypothetical protein H257_04933 [Aphanomyces astaci]|uniref:Uncharacterized protein n=1 Tax=Aphanomyces astaci TaxID=112090 RepID=W4GR84_APHAT|nr:hypothetical protein H257_04933 [Aphanomyces astaci]ETV82230.1 hypothetical protein H257_04933 [Aphanomyces astaci]|eukprot:XP_009827899.1 hypothetical protein H257_04933 [Aphanomyces astaci]